MEKSECLISLLIILGFTLLIAFLMEQRDKTPWKKTLGYPLYSVFKQALIHFQFLVAQSVNDDLDGIINLLKNNQK